MDCKIKNTLSMIVVLLCTLVIVHTSMAAIQLELTNDSAEPVVLEGYPQGLQCDSIRKSGSGVDIIPLSLINTGSTLINSGTLQFTGPQIILNEVKGVAPSGGSSSISGSSLIVGSNTNSTQLWVKSIAVDTLTVYPGSKLILKPAVRLVTNPEPKSLFVWAFIGVMTLFLPYYFHRK